LPGLTGRITLIDYDDALLRLLTEMVCGGGAGQPGTNNNHIGMGGQARGRLVIGERITISQPEGHVISGQRDRSGHLQP
jgi:hypothetical protein